MPDTCSFLNILLCPALCWALYQLCGTRANAWRFCLGYGILDCSTCRFRRQLSANVYNTRRLSKWQVKPAFYSGHPSNYWPRSLLLNLGDWMRTGVSNTMYGRMLAKIGGVICECNKIVVYKQKPPRTKLL
jgi:hypothetical protein